MSGRMISSSRIGKWPCVLGYDPGVPVSALTQLVVRDATACTTSLSSQMLVFDHQPVLEHWVPVWWGEGDFCWSATDVSGMTSPDFVSYQILLMRSCGFDECNVWDVWLTSDGLIRVLDQADCVRYKYFFPSVSLSLYFALSTPSLSLCKFLFSVWVCSCCHRGNVDT